MNAICLQAEPVAVIGLADDPDADLPIRWDIRGHRLNRAGFDGREIGTGFYAGAKREPYNPDFAALARACGVEATTVKQTADLEGALEHAINLNKPYLIDVHVDAEVRPPATGTWALPPIPHKEPVYGAPYVPSEVTE